MCCFEVRQWQLIRDFQVLKPFEEATKSVSRNKLSEQIWKVFSMNMEYHNFTKVTEILLLGFQNLQSFTLCFFFLLLAIFCVTICGNLLIILVVSYSRSLHSPMYFFLTQLSLTDILLSTTIVPNTLYILLNKVSSVLFIECLTQFYVFSASEALECLLLTVMSYDRYQAICNPLHYPMVMDLTFCVRAILFCWLVILATVLMIYLTVNCLDFCGPNIIDHFFCDLEPLLELSCSDTFIMKLETLFLVIFLAICPVIVIIVSYVYIIFTILKIPSVTGRQKTFSTCSAHLSVVALYYGSLITIYVFPRKQNAKTFLSLFYTVVTPFLNPMIYSLSNTDIKQAFKKMLTNFFAIFHDNRTIGLSALLFKERHLPRLFKSNN
ncbi:olfactory receptor 11L1-like [Bufo gargarizans]|uniref:olfactory receptor 11L1-like n=1 Tax=Bufo gargarizans TaxID=30331 RepID=UPI001CF43B13|nr:olfactory receptor 11L1-like [Bufo gargarizans]